MCLTWTSFCFTLVNLRHSLRQAHPEDSELACEEWEAQGGAGNACCPSLSLALHCEARSKAIPLYRWTDKQGLPSTTHMHSGRWGLGRPAFCLTKSPLQMEREVSTRLQGYILGPPQLHSYWRPFTWEMFLGKTQKHLKFHQYGSRYINTCRADHVLEYTDHWKLMK